MNKATRPSQVVYDGETFTVVNYGGNRSVQVEFYGRLVWLFRGEYRAAAKVAA